MNLRALVNRRSALDPASFDDMQAGIARAINHRHALYIFVRVDQLLGGRALLRGLEAQVIGGGHWGREKPPIVRNVAISAAGLRRLGVPTDQIDLFGPAFAAGMVGRAELLGDAGPSAVSQWDAPFAVGDAHILIWLHGDFVEELQADAQVWRDQAAAAGLTVVQEQGASMLGDTREHFGFADGAGQPYIDGIRRSPGQTGTITPIHDRPFAAGELVFGYRDALGVVDPVGRTLLGQNGTMLVLRKLHQDVARFRSSLAASAAAIGLDPDVLAAKLMGRWQDGSPLVLAPTGPPEPSLNLADAPFDFSDDPLGVRCPLGAHIRRGNPRDMLASSKDIVRHRIVRRAMPYGDMLGDGAPDDGAERGLMFGCFNASIERQFEFVLRNWMNDGSRMGRGADRDAFIGAPGGSGQFVIGGYPPVVASGLETFVTTRGGEYYFVPGRAALATLAWSDPASASTL